MKTLTAEDIQTQPRNMNEGFDYFGAQTEENLKEFIAALQSDDSNSDAVHLFLAANTALLLEQQSTALEFHYRAKIRLQFAVMAHGLGNANGNNVETYLGYLLECGREEYAKLEYFDKETLETAANNLRNWNPVPSSEAHPEEVYGKSKLSSQEQSELAKKLKADFIKEAVEVQIQVIQNPKAIEAAKFLLCIDEENEEERTMEKIEETSELLQKITEEIRKG